MVGLINNWQNEISRAQSLTVDWPVWLLNHKVKAATQLEQMESPNRKMETWRYSDTAKLLNTTEIGDKNLELDELDADVCIVVTAQDYSIVGNLPDWLKVQNIQQQSEKDFISLVAKTHVNEQAMLQLNHSLFHCGINLVVKEDQHQSDYVIAVVYDFQDNDWQYVRNQFVIGDNSQVTINEVYAGGRVNQAAAWKLGRDSKVVKTTWSQFESSAVLVSFNQMNVAQNADMKVMNYRHGGDLQHINQQVEFDFERAKFVSGSINKANNNSHISDIVNVYHNGKYNASEVVHRSIAEDRSQIFNNAKAVVAHGADHSEISQDLKNILLSDDAKIFSKPELEVSTDEVIAAHGSTIGALDESSLFYLQSRGIDINQAKDIMIESFVAEAEVC